MKGGTLLAGKNGSSLSHECVDPMPTLVNKGAGCRGAIASIKCLKKCTRQTYSPVPKCHLSAFCDQIRTMGFQWSGKNNGRTDIIIRRGVHPFERTKGMANVMGGRRIEPNLRVTDVKEQPQEYQLNNPVLTDGGIGKHANGPKVQWVSEWVVSEDRVFSLKH